MHERERESHNIPFPLVSRMAWSYWSMIFVNSSTPLITSTMFFRSTDKSIPDCEYELIAAVVWKTHTHTHIDTHLGCELHSAQTPYLHSLLSTQPLWSGEESETHLFAYLILLCPLWNTHTHTHSHTNENNVRWDEHTTKLSYKLRLARSLEIVQIRVVVVTVRSRHENIYFFIDLKKCSEMSISNIN